MSAHITSFTEQLIGTVLKDMFPRYRGKIIQKISESEWSVYGTTYPTLQEAQNRVDETYVFLHKSIK